MWVSLLLHMLILSEWNQSMGDVQPKAIKNRYVHVHFSLKIYIY